MTRTRKQLEDFRVITYHLRRVTCISTRFRRKRLVKVTEEFSLGCGLFSISELFGCRGLLWSVGDNVLYVLSISLTQPEIKCK